MYVVIFKAIMGQQNRHYYETVIKMRDLAFEKYNCADFVALTEGNQEIALSYWHSKNDISAWKNDPEHLLAQKQGKQAWYASFSAEIAKIERHYMND